jgi:hypothetical protein
MLGIREVTRVQSGGIDTHSTVHQPLLLVLLVLWLLVLLLEHLLGIHRLMMLLLLLVMVRAIH